MSIDPVLNKDFQRYVLADVDLENEDKTIADLLSFSLSRGKPNSHRTKIASCFRGERDVAKRIDQCLVFLNEAENKKEILKIKRCAELLINRLSQQEQKAVYEKQIESRCNERMVKLFKENATFSSQLEFPVCLDHVPEQDRKTVEETWALVRNDWKPRKISRKKEHTLFSYEITPNEVFRITPKKPESDRPHGATKTLNEGKNEETKVLARLVAHSNPQKPGTDRRLEKEIAILQLTKGNKGLVQFVNAITTTKEIGQKNVIIYLQYYNQGSLSNYISKIKNVWKKSEEPLKASMKSWNERIKIADYLIEGLANLHALGIAHNDIKPENCLAHKNEDGTIEAVLSDYDLSSFDSDKNSRPAGTRLYLSPEKALAWKNRLKLNFQECQQADVWALGLTLLELLYPMIDLRSFLGFKHASKEEVLISLSEKSFKHGSALQGFKKNDKLRGLLSKMLQYDPSKRPTAKEIRSEWASLFR